MRLDGDETDAPEAEAPLEDKVRFLSTPEAYPHRPARVEARETRMSWVFLTGDLVYKLKKPLQRPYLDFSTLARRKRNCEVELRLNRRLAPDVYLRVVALRRDAEGRLALGAGAEAGEVVDWLVEMRQLPGSEMLDERIRTGRLGATEIVGLAERLASFYQSAPPVIAGGRAYLRHIEFESAINRQMLLRPDIGLDAATTRPVLDAARALVHRSAPAILERIARGRIVEGHGDLRAEHVCLTMPVRIIDGLEFDRRMRLLDPYDEVNYLGLECTFRGAPWIRPVLLGTLEQRLGHRPDDVLMATYGAFRCILRARLCIAHLEDAAERDGPWVEQARRYLALAAEECLKARGGAGG